MKMTGRIRSWIVEHLIPSLGNIIRNLRRRFQGLELSETREIKWAMLAS